MSSNSFTSDSVLVFLFPVARPFRTASIMEETTSDMFDNEIETSPYSSTTLHNSSANEREIKETSLKSSVTWLPIPSMAERMILALERDLMSLPINSDILTIYSICFYFKYSVYAKLSGAFTGILISTIVPFQDMTSGSFTDTLPLPSYL